MTIRVNLTLTNERRAQRCKMRARLKQAFAEDDALDHAFDPIACEEVVRRFRCNWWRTQRHPILSQWRLHKTISRIREEWPADGDLARASEWLRDVLWIETQPERDRARKAKRSRGARFYDEYFAMQAEEEERAFAEQQKERLVVEDARDEQATEDVSELETETYGEPGGVRLNGPIGQWCCDTGKEPLQEAPHKLRRLGPNAIVHPADPRLPPIPEDQREESKCMRRARRHVAGSYWIKNWLADELEGRIGRLGAEAEVAEIRERLVRNIASGLRAGLPLPMTHAQFYDNEWKRLRLLSTLGGRRELAARLTKARARTHRCGARQRDPRAHQGLTRVLRSSPAPIHGSRRSRATPRTTGPPGDDAGGSEPPSQRRGAGALQTDERTKNRAGREQSLALVTGGLCRRVAETKNTNPREARPSQGFQAARANATAERQNVSRILTDAQPAPSIAIARARGGRDGRFGRGVLDDRAHTGGDRARA